MNHYLCFGYRYVKSSTGRFYCSRAIHNSCSSNLSTHSEVRRLQTVGSLYHVVLLFHMGGGSGVC